jgi:hypothetical protein
MKTPSRAAKSFLVSALVALALLAAGTVLAAPLRLPLPGPAAGLLVALLALRVGVMLSAARGGLGEEGRAGAREPARGAPLHAARV